MTSNRDIDLTTRSGLSLKGTVWDGGSQGVILAHGGGQTRHAWRRSAERIARGGYSVLAYDLRGHGESDWTADGDYSLSRLRDDLCDVIATFGQPPIVVGASLGGISAMLAVGEGAGAVRAVVLVDVAPRIEQAGSDQIVEFMRRHMNGGFPSINAAADAISAYLHGRTRPGNVDSLKKYLKPGPDGRFRWHWDPQLMIEPNAVSTARFEHQRLMEAAERMKVPVMLVRGGNSDVVSREAVEELLTIVPHARYVDLADAHHMVVGDSNETFTSAILEFIDGPENKHISSESAGDCGADVAPGGA